MRYLLAMLSFFNLTSFKPHVITPYPAVGYREIPFFDKTLQMPRTLLIWYPIEPDVKASASANPWDGFNIAKDSPIAPTKTKRKVIFLSHGFGGSAHQLSWLINKLVYNGYIVLGVDHLDMLDGKPHINHWRRAQDIHLALDQFASDAFSKSADLTRIGIAGFSLGGTTAIWLSGGRSTQLDHIAPGPNDAAPEDFAAVPELVPTLDKQKMAQDWTDPRIKAAFLMAPAWGWIFDKQGLQHIHIPTYIVAPEVDGVLNTQNNAAYFAKHIPHAFYQVILGPAKHYIFLSQPQETALPPKLHFLITDHPDVDRKWLQFEIAAEAACFFNAML